MNNYYKVFSAFLLTFFFAFTAFSQVSINNYPNDAMYIVKNGANMPITPIGCNRASVSFTFNKRSFDTDHIDDLKNVTGTELSWADWNGVFVDFAGGVKRLANGDSVNLTARLGLDDLGKKYQVYHYTMSCTPSGGGSTQTKKVNFVVFNESRVAPSPLQIKATDYTYCGNPDTGAGYQVKFTLNNIVDNGFSYQLPDGSGFRAVGNNSVLFVNDGEVQEGQYDFKVRYLDYYNSTTNLLESNDFTSVLKSNTVIKKTGSPVSNFGITRGLLLDVNNNRGLASAKVCLTDQVKLYWDRWDDYFNNPNYSNNYDFVWKKDNAGNFATIGQNSNNLGIANSDISGRYRLEFVPKGNSSGCPITGFGSADFALASIVVPAPSIVGASQVCPDGSIVLSVDKTTTMSDFNWTNESNSSISSSELLTVTAAGTYSITYKDSKFSNSLSQACPSPKVSQAVASFSKPVAPSITSNGKNKYCDYLTISDVLTASVNWEVKEWSWTTTATPGTSNANSYNAKGFGTYAVSYTDVNGCVSEKSTNFVIDPIARPATPSIKLTGNAFNCKRDESGNAIAVKFDLTSSPLAKGTIQWYNGSTLVQNSSAASLGNITSNSKVYVTQTDESTSCVSLKSNEVSVNFQENPTFASASITKAAYTLTANNLTDNNLTLGEFVWKVGTSSQNNIAGTQKVIGSNASEYSVARYASYTLNGNTIKCLSSAVKYAYVPDTEFSGVIVYPNPATTNLTIDALADLWPTSSTNTLSVYDLTGRLVFTKAITSFPITFNSLALSNGIYVLHLTSTNGNSFQTKLVVNK